MIVADAECSFGPTPNIMATSGPYTFFAGSRSDAFFFDFDGIKNLFDIKGKRNFTEPHLGGKSPWTGVDSNTTANVFSTAVEACRRSELNPKPEIHVWGRCSRKGATANSFTSIEPATRASAASSTPTTPKEEYNASEPVNDRNRWLEQFFIQLMGHTGTYTRGEAIAAIDKERTLPDVLSFAPSETRDLPQWPGLHRRCDQLSHRVPDEKRLPAHGPETPHRHPQGVPISRHAAFEDRGSLKRAQRCARLIGGVDASAHRRARPSPI